MMTITQALHQAKDLLGETRSGEILLAHVLKKNSAYLYTYPEKTIDQTELNLFQTLIKRRQQGEPIAYLIGEKEFYSLNFKVTQDTLIPRPETELLVEKALALLPESNQHILELGTGSGAIAVTLAKERPLWQITATDLSTPALLVAAENAKQHHLKNIEFIKSNWFQDLPSQQFDLIISNPPYIAQNDPHLNDLKFEPQSALQSGIDGLNDLKEIISKAPDYLTLGGWIIVEHGYDQELAVQTLLKKAAFENIQTLRDWANLSRLSVAQKV